MKTRFLLAKMVLIIFVFMNITPLLADGPIKVTQVDGGEFPEVTIYVSVTDDDGQPVGNFTQDDFQLLEDGQPVEILDFAGEGEARAVDIVFVFDTTGSMEDKIWGVKETSIAFADELRDRNRDFRLGLVAFGDEIREVRNSNDTLTDDAEEFKGWISGLDAYAGDDDPELALDALIRATEMSYRDDTQKILILITDAQPHYRGDGTRFSQVLPEEVEEQLRDEGFTLYAVAYDDASYQRLVNETNGEFYDIVFESDFTGIIEKIGGLIASQYRMTYMSARPSYDGTRRHIDITVGEMSGSSTYLEQHLVNIHSDGVIALILFLPLLVALVLPTIMKRTRARRSQPAAAGHTNPNPVGGFAGQSSQSGQVPCPHCDKPLRAGAKFCSHCGQTVTAPPPHSTSTTCPSCRRPLRPGSKFCSGCGSQV